MTENIPGPGLDEKEEIPIVSTMPIINSKGIPNGITIDEFKEKFKEANDTLGIENKESNDGGKTWEGIPPLSEVDKDIKTIIDQTEDMINKNPFDRLMEKLKKVLDINRDNKVDFQDLKEFLKLFAGVLVVVYFVIFTLERDEILAMWMTGSWDFGFLYNNIVFVGISAIGAYFFNMFKKRWLETDTLMVNYKTQSEEAHKIIAEMKFEKDLEIEKINHTHQLEIMNKEIQIRTKDEITRIEIVKADLMGEIRKLLPKEEEFAIGVIEKN